MALVKYICHNKLSINFAEFKLNKPAAKVDTYQYKDFYIIDLKGQYSLPSVLENIIHPIADRIKKIGIIQDADTDFNKSETAIKKAITDSKIPNEKTNYFLTPNNKDKGDLETLLLSTITDDSIVNCFDDYKTCLQDAQDIHPKALNKGQVYAYTMYSQKGENLYKPQDSFIFKNNDTNLWDLQHDNFKPIIDFVLNTFEA
ncbi:hypothetical protein SPONN_1117 [uncultured Candidatus Thioglobus sp.]|nr:hypothetical protein SPONN_1117 [uncultured Candidatus Thioglobus sp.]